MTYPGWSINEIRGMSARQREFWLKMINWKIERRRV